MRKVLKKYFIPHHENDYQPHFLREPSVVVIAIFVIFLFGLQLLYSRVVVPSNFFAAILPSVIVELTNSDRAMGSASPLAVSPILVTAAQKKADDMAAKGYFAHTSPEGITPWFWFGEVGYRFSYAGENLAVHFTESQDVETAWLNSPGHRANILNTNFTEIGVAAAEGTYQGVATTFIVEMFGRPALAAAPRPVAPASAIAPLPPPSVSPKPKPKFPQASQPVAVAPHPNPLPIPIPSATRGAKRQSDNLETITMNDMFVAVRNNDAVAAEAGVAPPPSSSRLTSRLKRAITSPRFVLDVIYGLLAIMTGISLIIAIVVEVEKQHPKHIIYGVFLLFLISTSFYASHAWLARHVLII